MVDITGHPAFGLLFALPTWYVWDGRVSVGVVALVAVASLLSGTLSHVVADVFAAPPISTPIEPFRLFFAMPWSIDLVWYGAAWIDYGFFAVMVGAHLGVAYLTAPADRRHRRRPL